VPGAQLPETAGGSERAESAESPDPPPELDPEAARALVDEFEAGVARALRSVAGDATTPTTEGDEK
jgi:hypothetical protein